MLDIIVQHKLTKNICNRLIEIVILSLECRHHSQTLAKIDQTIKASECHDLL